MLKKKLLTMITAVMIAFTAVMPATTAMTAIPVMAATKANTVALIETDGDQHTAEMKECILQQNKKAKIRVYKAWSVQDVTNAMKDATSRDVRVINMSIVFPTGSAGQEALQKAINKAAKKGIYVVAASGNDGRHSSICIPASLDNVITVGSCDANGNRYSMSNKGTNYNVNANYYGKQFTSHAAATMSGWLSRHDLADVDKVLNTGTIFQKVNAKRISVSLTKESYKYTGKAVKPAVMVKFGGRKLKKGTDYKLKYKNNRKKGTASVTVAFMGHYSGSKALKFSIK